MTPERVRRLIGKTVMIRWDNPADDWRYFRVLGVDAFEVWLRGVDDPEWNVPHDGDSFVVSIDEIREIRAVRRTVTVAGEQ